MTDDQVEAMLRELRAIRQAVERRHVPRDERHVVLLTAIAAAAAGTAFTTGELIAHAKIEGALREAIMMSCGGLNGRKLGRLLRRLEGVELGGHAIERCGEDSGGVIWLVKHRKVRLAIA
jgi:hypothetical protein